MNQRYWQTFKLLLFAIFYGGIAYSVWFSLAMTAWDFFPDASYSLHTKYQKYAGWVFTIIAALLAARAHRPSPRWSVATSIATSQVVQLLAAAVFVLRFGRNAYIADYSFWPTFFNTIAVGWFTGLVAAYMPFNPKIHFPSSTESS